MPTVLKIKNLLFMIHTRDHGFPHVTVYLGTPQNYEAMAKIRLDTISEIEVDGFDARAMRIIFEAVLEHREDFMEVWSDTREK
jgi:hypothetical protein